MIETDGPYPGYPCSSTNHSHHRNVNDSIYWQLKYQAEFYRILREREVYINQPDYYFYYGGNKARKTVIYDLFSLCYLPSNAF